ncbi:MAG: hypothetical protein BAJATHORv1_20489 [Candidatus Thorarchaeota archaeon]|nr:MAG: hypothetical protein BAJATHORv1_20489 [Candidatus Thorarchaeota archaeon]
MTERPSKPPIITSLADSIDRLNFDSELNFLIISSLCPEACIASAILCRGLIRAGHKFHLTFLEPIIRKETLSSLISSYSHLIPIVIGISILNNASLSIGDKELVSLGHIFDTENGPLPGIELLPIELGAAAYMLVRKYYPSNEDDLALASICSLLQSRKKPRHSESALEVVDIALDLSLIKETRGILLFGANFMNINEIFMRSIHPYISGITGNETASEKLLDSADISFSHRTKPLTSLNSDQIKDLSGVILRQVPVEFVPHWSGLDYLILGEKEKSYVYHISGIQALSSIAWANTQPGLLTGVLIGDRATLLRELFDLYTHTSLKVIKTMNELAIISPDSSSLKEDKNASLVTLDESPSVLSLAGQIAIQNSFIVSENVLVFESESELIIVWPKNLLSFFTLFSEMLKSGLECKSLSYQSISVRKTSSKTKERVLSTLSSFSGD